MFIPRKFSIPLCKITHNTPNCCIKGPVVHLSLCLRPSDMPITNSKIVVKSSRFMLLYTCMYSYVYLCVHILQVHYTYVYTNMNFNDSISNKTITVQNTLLYQKRLSFKN